MRSKDKVQAAIVSRLETRSGLDMKSLDVTTTDVSFDKNMAYATVAFHPKGDPAVNSGMVMKYTLEQRDGKWQVVKVGDSSGHSLAGHGASGGSELPPGHPSVGQMPDQPEALPPGHPQSTPKGSEGANGRAR